jgi:hypothetical protein
MPGDVYDELGYFDFIAIDKPHMLFHENRLRWCAIEISPARLSIARRAYVEPCSLSIDHPLR